MKFIKGNLYGLKYKKSLPSRKWKGTNITSDYKEIYFRGKYEYIGVRGGKYHFYNNQAGIDILLSKSEALEAINNYEI